MRSLMTLLICTLLAACGGEGGGDRNALAATACENAAKERLAGKAYQVDSAALAASMKPGGDGDLTLTAPIVIEPGLATEAKQIMECTVRFAAGKAEPDVISFVFNW